MYRAFKNRAFFDQPGYCALDFGDPLCRNMVSFGTTYYLLNKHTNPYFTLLERKTNAAFNETNSEFFFINL